MDRAKPPQADSAPWRMRREARATSELFLGQRRIYILPTGPGLGFGALLLVLLIGSDRKSVV